METLPKQKPTDLYAANHRTHEYTMPARREKQKGRLSGLLGRGVMKLSGAGQVDYVPLEKPRLPLEPTRTMELAWTPDLEERFGAEAMEDKIPVSSEVAEHAAQVEAQIQPPADQTRVLTRR